MPLRVEPDAGLEARFRELVATYAAAMRRLCAVYAANPTDREDLFQDVFLAVWKALPAFRGDASQRTWLYSIAHNTALTWQARDRRLRNRTGQSGVDPPYAPVDLRRMILYQLISRLPVVDRQIITLWLEGLAAPEIGEITGMRPATVAVRLTRIRQSLSETVQNAEEHHE